MNKLNIQQSGGFPLTTNTLDFLQNSLLLMQEFGKIAGNLTIISGCKIMGSNVTPGTVYINGEILPFVGGTMSHSVIITERQTKKQFEDGTSKAVEIIREARFGNSLKSYPWADFKRVKTLIELAEEKAAKTALEEIATALEEAKKSLDKKVIEVKENLDTHIADKNNPHEINREDLGILRVGTIKIGDVQLKQKGWTKKYDDYSITLLERSVSSTIGGDDKYEIRFDEGFGSSNYIVLANIQSNNAWNWAQQNDVIITVGSRGRDYFQLYVREVSQDTQEINLDFVIIKK